VDQPGEGGRRRIDVAARVVGPNLEGMAPVGQARVGLRARAGREAAAVEVAFETGYTGPAGVVAAEGEGGVADAVRVGRMRLDRRVGWRPVDRPGEGGRRRIDVAARVVGPNLEGMAPVGQARVGLRARAGREAAAVEVAFETGYTGPAGVVAAEGEGGVADAVRVGRMRLARRVGWRPVDRPGEGGRRRIDVADRVVGANLEGMAPVGQARVGLRARAGREAAAVEVAFETGYTGPAGVVAAEGEGGIAAARVRRMCVERRLGRRSIDRRRRL